MFQLIRGKGRNDIWCRKLACAYKEQNDTKPTDTFHCKMQSLLFIAVFRAYHREVGRGEGFAQAFHATPFSASNHIVRVTVVYIIYSRIRPPGINDVDLSDF